MPTSARRPPQLTSTPDNAAPARRTMQLWVILPVVVDHAAMGLVPPAPHFSPLAIVRDGLLTIAKTLVEVLPRPSRSRRTTRRPTPRAAGEVPIPEVPDSPPSPTAEEVRRGYRLLQAVLVPPFCPTLCHEITTLPEPYHEFIRAQVWLWRRQGRPNALMPFVAVVPPGIDLGGQVDPPLTEEELAAHFHGQDGYPLGGEGAADPEWEEEAYGWREGVDERVNFDLAVYQAGREPADDRGQ